MNARYRPLAPDTVALLSGIFSQRFDLNRAYLMSLKNENLLQNHYLEAGMGAFMLRETKRNLGSGENRHWGWESPSCQVRGHFLGHWLSAAARLFAATGDLEVKAKADKIVSALAFLQKKNGGEWVFSIPEKYLAWTAAGQPTWAAHYVVHKTLMGLVDMHKYVSREPALTILQNAAEWFHRWTQTFSRKQMDDLLDVETGGMLEVWADLFAVTQSPKHRELMERYTRARLFDPLLEGRDILTNKHANTTVPEVHGAARAYEVTGDARWRRIVEAYWKCAVDERGTFCTGGQTSGEIWTPPYEFASRRGGKTQEHCVVYNMIRLADYLFRWTGDVKYADYIERNLYNGILAQQHPKTGMIAYFLPLEAGGRKLWGTPTYDFWCCHGTLVQAQVSHNAWIYYQNDDELVVCQFIPSELKTDMHGVAVTLRQTMDNRASGAEDDNSSAAGARHRPNGWIIDLKVTCKRPVKFTLKLRVPAWASGKPVIRINGTPGPQAGKPSTFQAITRRWDHDTLRVEIPKSLSAEKIPDEPDTVAFLDGPVVLAGLCAEERTLVGDKTAPASLLVPDNERQWGTWLSEYRAQGQAHGLRFKPLHEITEEPYTLYFPIRPTPGTAARPPTRKPVPKRAKKK